MTGTNRFEDQRGVVIHGKAREEILGIRVKCYVVLKMAAYPPHALEKYDNMKSQNAVLVLLKNVIVNPSGKCGFEIISEGKVKHRFTFKTDTLASDWIRCLKECLSYESDLRRIGGGRARGFDVSLLPTAVLRFSGKCRLEVSAANISLFSSSDVCIVSWPLKFIRNYGINKSKFTLDTGSATVTGRAEFVFEVLKPWKSYHVYHEVAAQILSTRPPSTVNHNDDVIYERHPYEDRLPSFQGSSNSSCGNSAHTYEIPSEIIIDPEEQQMYFEIPHNLGMTFQLPNRSFRTIQGLGECVRHLEALLETNQFAQNNRLLLYGAPHCGKRTMAHALAMALEARVLCLQCQTVSTALSVENLRILSNVLDRVVTLSPCVFFIDNIHVVPNGFQNLDVGFEVLRMLTNFLNSASSNRRLVVVCSTAFPRNVDESLRNLFEEQQLYVPLLPASTRLQIIRGHFQDSPIGRAEAILESVAERTSGFTIAEIRDLCGELQCAYDDVMLSRDDDRLRRLAEVLERQLSEIECHENRQTNIVASASYYASQNSSQGIFFVTLESNIALPNVSSCFLVVIPSGLELRDLDPSHVISSWPSRRIRGFGENTNSFILETQGVNTADSTIFKFRTTQGAQILQFIQRRVVNDNAS